MMGKDAKGLDVLSGDSITGYNYVRKRRGIVMEKGSLWLEWKEK